MTIQTNQQPPILDYTSDSRNRHTHWLGWAVFLGVSWTWCIGMFLPVILVREYGVWGWVVFAIPNVLGAAAMGWVLRDAQASARLAAQHAYACRLFSAVTIAFHLFFALAVVAPLAESIVTADQTMDLAIGGILAGSTLLYLYITRRPDADRTQALIVLLISVAAMVWTIPKLVNPDSAARVIYTGTATDLLRLAPVCIFGFLLCPYLDLTFHRARQKTRNGPASFGVGFGFFFLLMIVFTLLYAGPFLSGRLTPWLAIFLCVHMGVQSVFTIAVHARELQHNAFVEVGLAAFLAIAAWVAYFVLPDGKLIHGLRAGEIIYRSFMGFYGLVFPAYIWLVMFRSDGPTKRTLAIFALVVCAVAPMFWMGFIVQKMSWLVPGLGIVLAARAGVDFPGKRTHG